MLEINRLYRDNHLARRENHMSLKIEFYFKMIEVSKDTGNVLYAIRSNLLSE